MSKMGQELERRLDENKHELHEALKRAKETIRIWHGEIAWEIYNDHSPEMRQINKVLAKVDGGN